MGYISIIAIVILLIIGTFFLMIFLPRPKCFYGIDDICRDLILFADRIDGIQQEIANEIINNTQKTNILYDGYLNPSTDNLPLIDELLRNIPNLKYAHLVELDPSLDEPIHKLPGDISNHTLQLIYCIRISGAKKTGIWCDGETKFFNPGDWIVFDHSRSHSLFNKHKRKKTLLLVAHVARPSHIPRGINNADTL